MSVHPDESLPDVSASYREDKLTVQVKDLPSGRDVSTSSKETSSYELSSSDVGFLTGQTRWNPSSDWDTYVVTSAAADASTLDAARSQGPEVGRQISEICNILLSIFTSRDKYVKFLDHRGEAAQDLLDILQKLLDNAPLKPRFRTILYVALVRLCRKSELCPRSFNLAGVTDKEDVPVSRDTFGDVYQARYNGVPVCLRSVRVYRERDSQEDFIRRKNFVHNEFLRAAVVWAQLSHANILPFYGTCFFDTTLCLVSPLVPNGNVRDFLRDRPEINRTHLIIGVAAGMAYLHKNGVAHGDLKCANVLVAEPEQALLTNFGFSYVTDLNHGLQGPALSPTHVSGGTFAFEAPERVEDPERRRDKASDVFAFGMLCYEMFASPSLEASRIANIHGQIVYRSMLPEHPKEYLERGLTDNMWKLMKKCWSHEPERRPTANEIKQQLPPGFEGDRPFNERIRPGFEPADITITKALAHLRAL